MREMTASDASRHFAAVLDATEGGETIVVTRGGRRVAEIRPAHQANGESLRAVFERWQGTTAIDASFAEAVDQARAISTNDLDGDPWQD